MPNTQTDLIDTIFDLADLAGKPQCIGCVYDRTGQAGTLDALPRDSGDLDPYAAAACDVLVRDADSRDTYLYTGMLTEARVATRLRIVAYVASVLVPPVVEDYDRRYTLDTDEDGWLPSLGTLEWAVSAAVIQLRCYLAEHDAGQWVDPNAIAGAVVNLHDAALAVETWWSLTAPAASADA